MLPSTNNVCFAYDGNRSLQVSSLELSDCWCLVTHLKEFQTIQVSTLLNKQAEGVSNKNGLYYQGELKLNKNFESIFIKTVGAFAKL